MFSRTVIPIEAFIIDEEIQQKDKKTCVFRGVYHGKSARVKQINCSHLSKQVTQNIDHLRQLRQTHIMSYLSITQDGDFYYFLREWSDGSLYDYFNGDLRRCDRLREQDISYQIASGLSYLHDQNIIHGHLIPENILLWERNHVIKISDFGLVDRQPTNLQKWSVKSDVISFASIVMYVATEGNWLTADQWIANGLHPTNNDDNLLKDLFGILMHSDPDRQLEMNLIVYHPYFVSSCAKAICKLTETLILSRSSVLKHIEGSTVAKWLEGIQNKVLSGQSFAELIGIIQRFHTEEDSWTEIIYEGIDRFRNLFTTFLWVLMQDIRGKYSPLCTTNDDDNGPFTLQNDLRELDGSASGQRKRERSTFKEDEWMDLKPSGKVCLHNKLGVGGFGSVYLGELNGTRVAMKTVIVDDYEMFQKEYSILQQLNNCFVVRCFGEAEGIGKRFIVMELCECSLSSCISRQHPELGPELLNKRIILGQIATGLAYIHEQGIVHKDLNPNNILLWRKTTSSTVIFAKITDFGLSKRLSEGQTHFSSSDHPGTTGYIAPEILESCDCFFIPTWESDIYSLGVVFFYVLSQGGHPFGEKTLLRDHYIITGIPNLQSLYFHWDAVDLVNKLIEKNPRKRPSIHLVLLHPFFMLSSQVTSFYFTNVIYNFCKSVDWDFKQNLQFVNQFSTQRIEEWFENMDDELKKETDQRTLDAIKGLLQEIPIAEKTFKAMEETHQCIQKRGHPSRTVKEAVSSEYHQEGIRRLQQCRYGMNLMTLSDGMNMFPKLFCTYLWNALDSMSLSREHLQTHFQMTDFEFGIVYQLPEIVEMSLQKNPSQERNYDFRKNLFYGCLHFLQGNMDDRSRKILYY